MGITSIGIFQFWQSWKVEKMIYASQQYAYQTSIQRMSNLAKPLSGGVKNQYYLHSLKKVRQDISKYIIISKVHKKSTP